MKVKVGAVQLPIDLDNFENNKIRAVSYAEKAAAQGCEILCYSEDFLTGAMSPAVEPYVQKIPGDYTDFFAELAVKYGLHIIAGSFAEEVEGKVYNTSVLINNKGQILGKYSKNHLWNGERKRVAPGDELPVFETKWGKVGIMICWDLAFPEVARELARKGAKIIFCPTLWSDEDRYSNVEYETTKSKIPPTDTERIFVEYCGAARAMENEVFIVLANACGEISIRGEAHHLFGNSLVAAPFQGILESLGDEEGILMQELDLDILNVAEEVYRIWEDYNS